jgi:predicted dehydrogenase
MELTSPIRIGLTGLGGYAGYVCDRLLDESRPKSQAAQLVAVWEPELDRFAARVQALRTRGVQVLGSLEQLLDDPSAEALWLPLPIDLHRSFTERTLAAGKAVLVEKPAAGSIDDVDAMIAARDRAKLPVAVGFQDAYQPALAQLKPRVMAGEFGRPLSVQVIGCWPRGHRYFNRNDWAGRLKRDGRWVMDSPAGNALAHYMHLPLLLLGPTLQEALCPTDVAAEMYRVNDIESYDTCSLRLNLPGDVPMYVAYTHACDKAVDPVVTIELERGTIRYIAGEHLEICLGDAVQRLALSKHPHEEMLRVFQRWVRTGSTADALGATLESARAHVVAVNVASEAAPIYDVPEEFVETVPARDHASIRVIRDIVPAMQECVARKCMLHETGRFPWSRVAGTRHINGYHHFSGPVDGVHVDVPARSATRLPIGGAAATGLSAKVPTAG